MPTERDKKHDRRDLQLRNSDSTAVRGQKSVLSSHRSDYRHQHLRSYRKYGQNRQKAKI